MPSFKTIAESIYPLALLFSIFIAPMINHGVNWSAILMIIVGIAVMGMLSN